MTLTPLEDAVLRATLDGEQRVLRALRAQLPFVCVVERELTGAGFFTTLQVSRGAAAVETPPGWSPFGDVVATIPGLVHGAGFLVYVEGGFLSMLEGYSYDEPWPAAIEAFSLTHCPPAQGRLHS